MRIKLSDTPYFHRVPTIDALLEHGCDASLLIADESHFTPDPFALHNLYDLPADYDRASAPAIANPTMWMKAYPETMPKLFLHSLRGAYLFGGLISERTRQDFGSSHGPGQLMVSQRGQLLPASYGVMDGVVSLPHNLVHAEDGDRVLTYDGEVTALDGTYLFLGQAHIHFGHFLLEGLSRLWALNLLPAPLRDTIRVLVYEPHLRPFATALLERLGIGPERIVHANSALQVEHLIVPETAMRTHHWIRPQMLSVWDRMAGEAETPANSPTHVFLSRPPGSNRDVENLAEIESLFAEHGYAVVYPGRLSIAEQITLMRGASHVAGLVGSQTYLCMFQKPGGTNLFMAPRNFFLVDDALISTMRRHHMSVVLGSQIDKRTGANWRMAAPLVRAALDRQIESAASSETPQIM